MSETISKSGLLERWNISLTSLKKWRKFNQSALRVTIIDKGQHFWMSQVLQAEQAGNKPIERYPKPYEIDGEKFTMTGALQEFEGRGIGQGTLRKRLTEQPKCTSRWLLRAIEAKAINNEPLPAARRRLDELMLDGTPMTPERAANYIAMRSQRMPVVASISGWRVSVWPKAVAPSGGKEFDRARPSQVTEWMESQ